MSDGVTFADFSGASKTQATDDISSVHYPRFKIQVGADGSATDLLHQVTRTETFSGTTSGTTQNVSAQGMSKFGLQVTKNGAVASWTVVLEVSLDGTTFSPIITHTNVTPGDGLMMFTPGGAAFPALYWRLRCSAYGGGGTNIAAIGVALP